MNLTAILSTKLTSKNIQHSNYSGFIDKLELNAKSLELSKSDLILHLRSQSILFQEASFRKGGLCLEITTPMKVKVYAKINYVSQYISKLILNPSYYENYKQFSSDALSLFGKISTIELLPVTRLDKSLDIACSYELVSRGFDIKNKRSANAYQYSSGINTGIDIGKTPEVMKLYDTSLKAKLSFPCTRLEACLTRNKINIDNIFELRQLYNKNSNYVDHTFSKTSFNDIEFSNTKSESTTKLSILCDHLPYLYVRCRLNHHGNFRRDYAKLHILVPWRAQPSIIFNTAMRKFFNDSASGRQ